MNPDLDVAVKFLEQLRPNGPWTITAIVPDGPTTTRTFTSPEDVRTFIAIHNPDKNIYYQANPHRTENKRPKKTDITQADYIHSDLDPKDKETREDAKARYLAKLETIPKPTLLVDSGNGIQALWRLETALGPEHFPAVEACSKAIMVMMGAETGPQDVSHLLRLPGTVNWPNRVKKDKGRDACMSKLLWANGARYPLAVFPQDEPNRPGTPEDGGHHEQQDTLPPALVALLHLPNARPCGASQHAVTRFPLSSHRHYASGSGKKSSSLLALIVSMSARASTRTSKRSTVNIISGNKSNTRAKKQNKQRQSKRPWS